MSPQRIQLKRTKGWRKPEGAIVVSRPTKWGNPFRIGDPYQEMNWFVGEFEPTVIKDRAHAKRAFAENCPVGCTFVNEVKAELRGHDLACWCPLDQPCHADVLLELANA